jgi:hypothetical protein
MAQLIVRLDEACLPLELQDMFVVVALYNIFILLFPLDKSA